MGGPCLLVEERADAGTPGPRLKKTPAPSCTDNFQISQIRFFDREWWSVEHAYQGLKFVGSPEKLEEICAATPNQNESDFDYGQRVWRLGQQGCWDPSTNTVELMYQLCCAKYEQHPEMKSDLLSTGSSTFYGGPSTGEWSKWNGLIQMQIREELRREREAGGEPGQIGRLRGKQLTESLEALLPRLASLGLVR